MTKEYTIRPGEYSGPFTSDCASLPPVEYRKLPLSEVEEKVASLRRSHKVHCEECEIIITGYELEIDSQREQISTLQGQLETVNKVFGDGDREQFMKRHEALQADLEKQCRLNGMGAQREAALMGKVERLERENDRLRSELKIEKDISDRLEVTGRELLNKLMKENRP